MTFINVNEEDGNVPLLIVNVVLVSVQNVPGVPIVSIEKGT
jgi:hypothetical protein